MHYSSVRTTGIYYHSQSWCPIRLDPTLIRASRYFDVNSAQLDGRLLAHSLRLALDRGGQAIGLKAAAYWLTGSVGLLSDALESLVNLVAAARALAMLTLAARPAEEEHA